DLRTRCRAAVPAAHHVAARALLPRRGGGRSRRADRRPRPRERRRPPLVERRGARGDQAAVRARRAARAAARRLAFAAVEVVVIVHLLAACVWVGGSVALVVAGVPAIRILEGEPRGRAMREIGRRWRVLGYGSLLVLAVTGVPLAQHDYAGGRSPFDTVLWVKVGLSFG